MLKKIKSLLCFILIFLLSTGLCACSDNTDDIDTNIKLIDTTSDQHGNILNQIFYNEATGEYIIKEYSYEYISGSDRWQCIDQQTKVVSDIKGTYIKDPALSIYYNTDLLSKPIILIDNEYAEISIIKYLAQDQWWEFGYELKIVNKTKKIITMSIDDAYIMNIQCEPLFSIDHIDAGKTAYFTMAWDIETLERCHIPYIDNIEFMIRLFDNEDWTSPAFTGERVLIKTK